ncbi:TolC family protein [Neisseria sp. P0020.S005]|jgi:type I secretion outer membrane protein, tolC family|uniref:TolC family protein n=1 Tax=Neisseria sp. P0020.S005 TaxID=3436810 RepID=UPI003F807D6E
MSDIKLALWCILPVCLISPSAHSFTLFDAWQAALEYSADYSAAKYERDAEAAKKVQARAELLPQASANYQYQRQPYSLSSNTQSNGWNVQVSQVLFDRSKFAQYKQGKLAEEMADIRLDNSGNELQIAVANAYFDVLMYRDKLKAIREEKAAYEKQVKRAQEMFHQGVATVLDTHEAMSGYDNALSKEVDTLTNLRTAENTLANLTGLDPNEITVLKMKDGNDTIDLLDNSQEYEWQSLAEVHNPEWQLQRKNLENARQEVKVAKGARIPTVTVNGGYTDNRGTYHYDYSAYGASSFDQDYRSKGAMFNIQISMPLFTGGKISGRIKEAASREMQNRELLTAAERKIRLDIKQAYYTIHSNKMQIMAQQRLLESSRAKLEATRLGRQVGVRNNLEETQAQQAASDAEQKLAEAKYSYIKAYLRLLQSAGVLKDENRIRRLSAALF